jgi:hypothetical protein
LRKPKGVQQKRRRFPTSQEQRTFDYPFTKRFGTHARFATCGSLGLVFACTVWTQLHTWMGITYSVCKQETVPIYVHTSEIKLSLLFVIRAYRIGSLWEMGSCEAESL